MKKRLQNLVEKYVDGSFTINDLIYNLKIYDRQLLRIKTKYLIKELHPTLQSIYWDFIKKVEEKTNFIYSGIFSYKNNLKHYHVKFQHKQYFSVYIDFSYGVSVSCGDKYWIEDDSMIHVGACDGSAEFVYGQYSINDEKIVENLLNRIIDFNESIN